MKSFATKIAVAALGLFCAAAPLAANADPVHVGVTVRGPGYAVHYGNGWQRGYWRPAYVPARRPVYVDGAYGWAPAGFYGYYWHGGWYHHRRWANGVWVYFCSATTAGPPCTRPSRRTARCP